MHVKSNKSSESTTVVLLKAEYAEGVCMESQRNKEKESNETSKEKFPLFQSNLRLHTI